MKQRAWLSLSALTCVLIFLYGCTAIEPANYTVTSYAEITLDEGSMIRVVAGRTSEMMAEALEQALEKSGKFKVAKTDDEKQNADYWLVIRGTGDYREPIQALVNEKIAQNGEAKGEDVIVKKTVSVASAARELALAIYDAKRLAPIHYMTVAVHDGDNAETVERNKVTYETQFAYEVVERLKDALLTQQKEVEISIPLEASADIRAAFKEKDYERVTQLYKEKGEINIAEYVESIRSETCEDDNIDEKLANYHMYLLVREATEKDAESLTKIKAEQLMLLQVAEAGGLIEAVPMALARIENQLKYAE